MIIILQMKVQMLYEREKDIALNEHTDLQLRNINKAL